MRKIFFEPWGLGDAIIAASFFRNCADPCVLVVDQKWLPIMNRLITLDPNKKIIGVDPKYTRKFDKKFGLEKVGDKSTYTKQDVVYSIRGDVRDYFFAKMIFKKAKVKMQGWYPFLAFRYRFFDLVYSLGLVRPQNRYESWEKLTGIKYMPAEALSPKNNPNTKAKILIHIGAQWSCRQFPNVKELVYTLENLGFGVTIVRGPGDPLPDGIEESRTVTLINNALIDNLMNHDLIIANDSGVMHLSCFLGRTTLVISRVSCIKIWGPPRCHSVSSKKEPTGFNPDPEHLTSNRLSDWPEISDIMRKIQEIK